MKDTEVLKQIGLTDQEAKVYQGLIKRKYSTASELSKMVGVSRVKVYGVLESLKDKGYCEEVLGKIKRYAALPPDNIFPGVIEELKLQQEQLHQLFERYQSQYEELKEEADESLEFVSILSSRVSILDYLEKMQSQAKKSVKAFVKKPYVMNVAEIESINTIQEDRQENGITYKGIYEADYENSDHFIQMLKYFEKLGERVRIVEKLPSKFFLFDKKDVILLLEGKIEKTVTAMTIEHEDLVQTLSEVFDRYWKRGCTIEDFMKKI
ncbi:MAG: TrmB family transcriptional regulator [Bacteroidales bacterium]